jgi:polyhydroxybutyrate depolymerase
MNRPATLAASALLLSACGGGDGAAPRADAGRDAGQTVDVAPVEAAVEAPDVVDAPAASPDRPAAPDAGSCAGRAGVAGDRELHLRSGGVDRVYRVHVPRSYDAAGPAQVVFNFHGYLSNEVQQADWSNLNEAADARGFIAVHPRGRDSSWNAGVCCGNAMARGDDDVAFVRAVLDAVSRDYCVDPRRVYATGFSNGAFFANRLACEMSDRFAAIAAVSGLVGVTPCAPARPVPVINFHGDADLVVPYQGSALLGFPAVVDSTRGWVTRDGCNAAGAETLRRGDARCVSFGGCAGDAEVVLCTLSGGGHTWPGGDVSALGGRTSRDLDATSFLLDFFARHAMP